MSFRAETENKFQSALKMSTGEQVEGMRGPEGIYYYTTLTATAARTGGAVSPVSLRNCWDQNRY